MPLNGSPRLAPMADLTRDDVAHLAALARIDLSEARARPPRRRARRHPRVGGLGPAGADDDVEPMSHPLPLTNVTRPDGSAPLTLPQAARPGRAGQSEQQRFSVPRILDAELTALGSGAPQGRSRARPQTHKG